MAEPDDEDRGDRPTRAPRRRRPTAEPRRGPGRALLLGVGLGLVAVVALLLSLGGEPQGLARWPGTYTVVDTTVPDLLGKRVQLTATTLQVIGRPVEPYVDAGEQQVKLRVTDRGDVLHRWGWREGRLWIEEVDGSAKMALEPVR